MRREKWDPSPNTFLCSNHFEAGCFFQTNGKKLLKPDAVPNIFNFPDHLQKKQTTPRVSKRSFPDDAESSSASTAKKRRDSNPVSIFSEHNYALLDPQKKIDSLLEKNRKTQQSLKVAQQAVRRKELSLQEKDKVILELQNRLGEMERDVINSSFSPVLKELLTKNNYSDEAKKFALTLNFYSSAAYDFLREYITLPHPSSLRRWAEKIDFSPGFTESAIKRIENIAKEGELFCCLTVDEMSLKKQVDWDGKEVVGYCDLGHGSIDNDSVDIATSALVFMVTAINGSWKIPIGYCFVNGLSGSVRANLVSQYIF